MAYKKRNVKSSFTREVCYNLAKQCKSRAEFKRFSKHGYHVARINGWLDDYTWFLSTHEAKSKAMRKYTDAEIADRAKKFTRLIDFEKNDPCGYQIAWRRGIIPTFTWLSRNVEAASRHYTDAVYVYEFIKTNTAYVGRSIEPINRDNDHRQKGDSVYEYAKAHGLEVPPMKILYDGVSPQKGAIKECETIDGYRLNGWHLLNKAKGGSLGQIGSGWMTHDKCIAVAKKFSYIQDFIKAHRSMYDKMLKHGWIKECTWLKYYNAKPGTYVNCSKKQIKYIASKFKSRYAFQKGARTAYYTALKNGWIDVFFPISHTNS